MSGIPAADLERRKQVRLRLRPDLIVSAQRYEQRTCYVVKDPLSLRYYRFDERDHFLLQMLDGSHTMEEVQRRFEEHFRPQRLTWEDLEAFGQLLLQAGLADHDLPQAGQQLWERRQKRRRLEWLQRLTSILYIEIPLFDPDPLLTRLERRLGWLVRPWSLAAGLVVMLAALLLITLHFDAFRSRLPSFEEFFRFRNLVYLWLALAFVKVIHEFGHGLVCKAFGGEVHDMGALLMCLSPCLYLNVSDAWTFPEKWKRVLVGLAGIYVELLIAALATFVWWHTARELLVNQLCLSLMIVCSVNTVLFNGNPLLRFDGYYVLADWLEIPNLRERCNVAVQRFVVATCLGVQLPPEPSMAWGQRALFVAFAVASYLYSWIVTCGAIWFLSQFLKPYKLGTLSTLLALAAVGSMIGWPLYRLGKHCYQRRLPTMQPLRVGVSLGAAGLLLLAFFFLPLPISRIRETALVQPRVDAVEQTYLSVSGTLERLHVRDGQPVERGDILAEFRSLEVEGQLEEARTQLAVRLVQLQVLRQQLADSTDERERSRLATALAQVDGERRTWGKQLELHQKKLQSLVLRAPRSGTVLNAPRRDEVGKLWDRGQTGPVCGIADTSQLQVLVPLTPADFQLVQQDRSADRSPTVTIRVQGWGGRTWQGHVTHLPESEARHVPLGLTTRAGGTVPIKPGTATQGHAPQSQLYLVGIDFHDTARARIWPGSLAQVKIHCRWRPAAWWVWRKLSAAFDLGLMG